ncbi:MAG: Uncharacterized protein G01um101470_45 [Parcubacteria group bacterium Gr01-1014_70]|nr:MAG: Uncharacterized protein G01um101470_45 [Parcubacteria group bacterium Gr01-1014_70]
MKKVFTHRSMFMSIGGTAVAAAAVFMWSMGSADVPAYVAGDHTGSDSAAAVASAVSQTPPPPQHISTPSPLHAIYMSSWVAGTPSLREGLVEFMRTSEINAVVIDVKDYSGKVSFHTGDAFIEAVGSEEERVPNMRALIEDLHRQDIYTIARISVFQDPHFATHRPDLAVKTVQGSVWKDRKGISWVDPSSKYVWEYILHVARSAEAAGFDELNFDYVRFPSDGNMTDISFPVWDEQTPRSDVLESFFSYLNTELSDVPVPISLDLFGMTMTNTDDLNIGQVLEKAAPHADYIAPMVYPSHYPNGWNNLSNPAASPYEVIHYAISEGVKRLEAMRVLSTSTSSPWYGMQFAELRPWIQDFDLGADYTADMIQKQKQAVFDVGLDSWMAWDPKNVYTREAYTEGPGL